MKAIRYVAAVLLALVGAGGLAGQQTTTTATLHDPTGTVWINAPYTIDLISRNPPTTKPGNQQFQDNFVGVTDNFGSFSVALQRVANINPANTTWQFCVVSGVSFTQKFCVSVPVGNAGQSTEDVSAQINALLTTPVINGGPSIRAYNDAEVQPNLGAMYFNVNSLSFRCYNGGWGVCGGTGTGIGTITWALPSILSASPTTLNSSGTQNFLLTTQSANTVFAGPTSGSAAVPTFRSLVLADFPTLAANTVLGQTAIGVPIQLALPNCNTTGSSALIYTASTGFGCNAISSAISSLTTTGTSGAATLGGGVLNIPQYQAALTLTTTGATGAATLIGNTLNVPQYAGAVSSLTTIGTSGAATLISGVLNIPQYSGGGIASITWALPSFLTASPTTISATGTQTFSLATQSANTFFAGPASGSAAAPTFRAFGLTDLPSIAANTVLGETASGAPTALSLPSCSGVTNALIWTSGSGFGCNTISGGGGAGLPTAPAAGYMPASTSAGTTYAAVNNLDWTAPFGLDNLNGDFYVDAVLSPTSCTVSSVSYTTAFDCALANAKLWVATGGQQNATLHVGSNGFLLTNLGIQEPTAVNNHGTVNIIGGGVNASILKLNASLSSGVCMLTQPAEATALNYATVTVSGLTLDANSDADCIMQINGTKNGHVEHVVGKNVRAGSGNIGFQVGPSSASTSTVFETFFDDVKMEGTAGGYTPAIITCTVSSGNPVCTITDAGSYPTGTFSVQVHGVGNGSGACSVYPTWTATGTTTLTGLTATGGTCVAPIYVSVTPAAKVDYNFLIGPGATDSTFKDLRAVESSVFAGIKTIGHPNTFIHPHCYVGQYACVEDYGSSDYYSLESDSIGGYAAVIEQTGSRFFGVSQIYNNFQRYAGSALWYVDQAATTNMGVTVSGVGCNGNRQTQGGYHNLVVGSGLPYTNTSAAGGAQDAGYPVPAGVQMDNVLDCSTSPTVNTVYPHIGAFWSTGAMGIGATPATACSPAGCLAFGETSIAGTPTAGLAYIRADSVSNTLRWSVNGGAEASIGSGGGSSSFASLTSGTNTTAAMLVNTGASLGPAGSGTVTANAYSGLLPGANGGTGNGFFAVVGPLTSLKTFTFPNASATVLTTNALVTVPQGGTGVGTLTGIAKGNGTSAFTAAASSDVIGLWTGSCSATTYLRGDGSCVTPSGSGNTTSTSLTTNTIPKANGANSIINSLLTDSGTTLGYTGTGGITSSGPVTTGASPPTACGTATGCVAMIDAGTAGTPTSGQAYLRADSASGHLVYSINGSAEANLVASSAPLTIPGSGMTTGNVYYAAGSGLTAAEANASTTVPGICYATSATICQINGTVTTSGLTAGAVYYISDSTPGALTATAPTTSGHFVQRFGVALSTTVLYIQPSLDVGGVQ